MAKALGGDSILMSSTITLQTITGVFYLPGLLILVASFTT